MIGERRSSNGGLMTKYLIARQLSGKKLVTSEGEDFGRLVDLEVNEVSGGIESLVVEPNPDSGVASKMKKDDGMVHVPYNCVLAVGDYIIVEKRNMSM
jgi:sporulation protein YlmC with PRC-barrel domain